MTVRSPTGRILVTGGGGQLGRALARCAGAVALAREDLDITEVAAVRSAVAGAGVVINAAGYTDVDRAEAEPAAAFAVNRDGAENLARACAAAGARLIHVSTDYVFDGSKDDPYRVDDPVSPLGVYGRSKAAGETAVLGALPGAVIVRTSWLFGIDGRNFVKKILGLAAERSVLRVVADQRGCPTFAGDLAAALIDLAAMPGAAGVHHFCGEGAITRHGFAEAIVAAARARGATLASSVEPISSDRSGAARRPASSVLDTSRIRALGILPRPWRNGLEEVLDALVWR